MMIGRKSDAIDAASFDAAGTLFRVREPVGTTYARVGRRHGLELDACRLEKGFRNALARAGPLAFPGVADRDLERHERSWWRRIVEQSFAAAGVAALPSALFEELFAHYASATAWQCYDDVRPALLDLRARGHRLCVISNFDSRLVGLMADLGLAGLLDGIIASSRSRAAKPDPAIFQRAVEALGTPPHKVVHVGDDPVADVHGARQAGLQAVLIRRSATSRADAPAGIPIIHDLRRLGDVLPV